MFATVLNQLKRGILADQGGEDTIEYVAIGGLILAAIIVALAIIRNRVIEGAQAIDW